MNCWIKELNLLDYLFKIRGREKARPEIQLVLFQGDQPVTDRGTFDFEAGFRVVAEWQINSIVGQTNLI